MSKELHKSVNEAIGSVPGLKERLKVLFDAAAQVVNPTPAPAPVKLEKQMKTKDGSMTVSIAGEAPAPGVEVMNVTGEPMPLADGSYVMEDDSTIVVAGGKITEYKPMVQQAAAPATTFEAQFEAVKTEFANQVEVKFQAADKRIKSLEAENEELKKSISDQNTQLKTLVEFAKVMSETPVQEPGAVKTRIEFTKQLSRAEYNKLSAVEQTRHNEIFGKPEA